MEPKILFTVTQEKDWNSTDLPFKLHSLKKKGFQEYYDQSFVDDYLAQTEQRNSDALTFNWYPHNAPGKWMSENIKAQNKLIEEPVTAEQIKKELESDQYTHLVVSTYLSGYSDFKEIAEYVHANHPDIKVIAGSVGALVEETKQYADYILRGNQVDDLRGIIGEKKDDPLKVVVVESDTSTNYKGLTKNAKYALLITSYGCMYGCDFCPSTAQFGQEYKSPFTAGEIKQAIIKAHDEIDPESQEFTISLAESQGLGDIKLWKNVFEMCKDLPFTCNLVTTTSSKVISQYSLDELTLGALRLSTVNIGVESMIKGYKKNSNVDLKNLISRLQESGINVVVTYIIGLDWQTRENLEEEARLLKTLDASGYIVASLEMQPNTPLFNSYKAQDRLLNVPTELLSFSGFQAYKHPAFKSGFNDMLPLLDEMNDKVSVSGSPFAKNIEILLNRKNPRDAKAQNLLRQNVDQLMSAQEISKQYFQSIFSQMDLFHPFILTTN